MSLTRKNTASSSIRSAFGINKIYKYNTVEQILALKTTDIYSIDPSDVDPDMASELKNQPNINCLLIGMIISARDYVGKRTSSNQPGRQEKLDKLHDQLASVLDNFKTRRTEKRIATKIDALMDKYFEGKKKTGGKRKKRRNVSKKQRRRK